MLKIMIAVAMVLAGCEKSSSTQTAAKDAASTPSPTPVPSPGPTPVTPSIPLDAFTAPTPDPEPAATCAHTCNKADDCPSIPCKCEDGTVVNTRNCFNNCCRDETEACSSSCKPHDGPKGTWNDARDGKRTGRGCRADSDCASNICLHGVCSKTCMSFGDCPPFWDCVDGKQPGQRLCTKKD